MDKLKAIEQYIQAKEKRIRLKEVLNEIYSPEETKDILQIISSYFGKKLSIEMQKWADEKGWTSDTYNSMGKEHLRIPYQPIR
jgi:hypothetical protein